MLGAAFLLGIPLNVLVEKRFRVSNEATTIGKIDALEGHGEGSGEVGRSRSSSACRTLFLLIVSVQIILLFTTGFLNKSFEHTDILAITKDTTFASRANVTSLDDYNSFDLDSVLRLKSAAEVAVYGRLSQPGVLPPYDSTGFYENGSVPDRRVRGKSKPGVPRILFVGDSHTGHLKFLAYHISREFNAHVQVWQAPGCVFLLNTFNSFLNVKVKERAKLCHKTKQLWKENILKERFDTVVLAGRWAWLVEEDRYGSRKRQEMWHLLVEESAPPKKRFLSDNPSEWHAQYDESRQVFRKSIEETVRFLTGTGAHVALFGQVPLLKSDPSGCTAYPGSRKAIAEGKQPDRCVTVTREMAMSRMKYVREVFEDVRQKNEGNVSTIHLTDVLCDNYLQDRERCRVVIKDMVLYRDKNHLNGLGACYIALRLKAKGYEGVQWNYLAQPRERMMERYFNGDGKTEES